MESDKNSEKSEGKFLELKPILEAKKPECISNISEAIESYQNAEKSE